MGDEERVLYQVADRIATITLNRPEKRNAITFAMRDAIVDYLDAAGADRNSRVVVVRGNGPAFTSGVDIGDRTDLQDPSARTFEEDLAEITSAARSWERLWELPKPVLVKAHGHCIGWGLEIALHADMVLASLDCRFAYPSVSMGSGLPDSTMAIYHLGPQWAKRLLLAGDTIDGRTAARIGLVMEALPDDELDGAIDALARRMAALPPDLLAESKRVVNRGVDLMGRAVLLDVAAHANAAFRRSPSAAAFMRLVQERGGSAAIESRSGDARPADPSR